MRLLLLLMVAIVLAGCGPRFGPTTPDGAPPAAPTLPMVSEILAGAQPGPVATVGYLVATPAGAALVTGLSLSNPTAPAPLSEDGIWLGSVALPPDVPATTVGELSYLLVEATGRLAGPGRFGPAGRYSYSLSEPRLEGRSARDLTIATLLANSGAYEGQPIKLRGQLLTSPDTALLLESLGAGGVPDASARQVKLAIGPADPRVIPGLQQSANGRVHYGPVEMIGVWRAGVLYPLATTSVP